jgi:hypothetical protein
MSRPAGTYQFPDCLVCTNPKIHEHTDEEIAAAEQQQDDQPVRSRPARSVQGRVRP